LVSCPTLAAAAISALDLRSRCHWTYTSSNTSLSSGAAEDSPVRFLEHDDLSIIEINAERVKGLIDGSVGGRSDDFDPLHRG
jgi:hypothetical protein